MKRSNRAFIVLCIVMLALALCVPAAQSQQKDPRVNPPVKPLPPIGLPSTGTDESSSAGESSVPSGTAGQKQDRTPLAGVQEWSPSGSGAGHNLLLTSLSVHFGGDTKSNGGGSTRLSSVATVGGTVALQRVWRTSQFVLDYAGRGSFYMPGPARNRSSQNLGLSFAKTLRLWNFYVADDVHYSPEGGYGRGMGLGLLGPNPNVPNNGLVNLDPLFLTDQSVVATNSPRISNTLVGQAQFSPNARSSITFGGSYGILRFIEPGFFDNHSIGFRAGYDRTLTAKDTLAVSYSGRLFRYEGSARENMSNIVYLTYGRTVSNRLRIRVSAGPQFTQTDNGSGTPGSKTSRLSWSMHSSLHYLWEQSSLGFSYLHAVTGGAGYFVGASMDTLNGSYAHRLSRMWAGNLHASHFRSQNLMDFLNGVSGQQYRGWRAGYGVSRPLGRRASIYLNYSAQYQTSANVNCSGPNCAFSGIRHIFGIGFNYHPSAIRLE